VPRRWAFLGKEIPGRWEDIVVAAAWDLVSRERCDVGLG
jgi:hypothetical protein